MIKKKRILICGGRTYNNKEKLNGTLDFLQQYFEKMFCVIHGGATGADTLAGEWAKAKGIPVIVMEANWDYYKKSAGTIRNLWMTNYCFPDLVIAFPGGNGTANMIKIAKQNNIDFYKVQ